MATRRVTRRREHSIPPYTVLGCPLTKNRVLWCHRLCAPKNGIGACGRVAPHAVQGRTAEAIHRFKTVQIQGR